MVQYQAETLKEEPGVIAMRKIKLLFFIIFISILLIPTMLTDTKGEASDSDGRVLTQAPAFGEEKYTEKQEKWLKDRLGFADDLAAAHALINDKAFGELVGPTYQYGKNGYIFYEIHSNIAYSDYHKQFAKMVANMQLYCESRGTKFYYVFVPEKESVYKRFLPTGVNYDDEWVDSMLAEMKKQGVNCIDLSEIMTDLSYEGNVFNRQFDVGHWNQNGAYYGMREIIERMQKDIPEIKSLTQDEYELSTTTAEKLSGSSKALNESVPRYSLKGKRKDITGDFATELERSKDRPYFQLVRNDSKNAADIKRMLLFEDEIYGSFAFARSKETAVLTCLQNAVNFDYYYNIFKPDVVIFEHMEHVVNNAFFSQTAMESAKQNPSILANFPESDFLERRDLLLEQTEERHFDAAAVLVSGKAIDKVYISNSLNSAGNAYLITDDMVIDLRANDKGALIASVRHGALKEGSYVALYILNDNNEGSYAYIPVIEKKKNIIHKKSSSDNIVYDKANKRIIMTNETPGDAFNYTAVQLYDADIKKCLATVSTASASGTVDGAYCHRLPTGDYKILLKSGSRITREWIAYKVHLTKGKTYWFSYNVDDFSDKKVTFSNFNFYEPAEVVGEYY